MALSNKGDWEFVLYGYHLVRAILRISETTSYLMPSLALRYVYSMTLPSVTHQRTHSRAGAIERTLITLSNKQTLFSKVCFLSQSIGLVNLENVYFYHQKIYVQYQSIQKTFNLIFKDSTVVVNASLVSTAWHRCRIRWHNAHWFRAWTNQGVFRNDMLTVMSSSILENECALGWGRVCGNVISWKNKWLWGESVLTVVLSYFLEKQVALGWKRVHGNVTIWTAKSIGFIVRVRGQICYLMYWKINWRWGES